MSFNQVAHVTLTSLWRVLQNKINFFADEVSSVLQNELWVGIEQFDHKRGFDVVMHLEVVEKACHVGNFRCKNAIGVFALRNLELHLQRGGFALM